MTLTGIRARALALVVIPMTALAIALGVYFTKLRIDAIHQALHERGESLARLLGPAAEFGILSANLRQLRELVQSLQMEPEVSAVVILDSAGNRLAEGGAGGDALVERIKRLQQASAPRVEQDLYFVAVIRRSAMELNDSTADTAAAAKAAGAAADRPIGYVGVSMSRESAAKAQQHALLSGGAITLAALALSALLSLRLTRGISRPIERVAAAVDQIARGDLSVKVSEQGAPELVALAQGVNGMARALKSSQDNLQEKIRVATEQLSYQATHDTLTGLMNRRDFENRLERALATAQQRGNMHALCFLDLDQFKVVNDTCGHGAGDELLRQIGAQLKQRIRERDTLARIGGDEFSVLLENCHLDDALEVAQQLRETVQNFRFAWEEKIFTIGVSIGIVMISHISESVAVLLSQADSACYTAKDLGRNRVHVFDEDNAARHARVGAMEWVSRINRALQDKQFVLYGQSILPLKGTREGDPYHYEILLRMRGEGGEVIEPMAFIPPAERFNQMQAIDRWVVGESLQALRKIQRVNEGKGMPVVFSINLSGSSIGDERFAEFLREQFAALDVSPKSVMFEITETAAIGNFTKAVNLIQHLRRMGCRFVLDDFGAGLSSFTYLKHLPVEGIKIDGTFVRGMAANRMDYTMVESINNIGHAMGLSTTAEFVEDDSIMRRLLGLGVDFAQGNWVHRPRPLEELFANQLESRRNVDQKLRLITGGLSAT